MTLPDVIEVNHCHEGRFECDFTVDRCTYLGKGDLSVNMLTNHPKSSWFHFLTIAALSILSDNPFVGKVIRRVSHALGGMLIDLYEMRDKSLIFCPGSGKAAAFNRYDGEHIATGSRVFCDFPPWQAADHFCQ